MRLAGTTSDSMEVFTSSSSGFQPSQICFLGRPNEAVDVVPDQYMGRNSGRIRCLCQAFNAVAGAKSKSYPFSSFAVRVPRKRRRGVIYHSDSFNRSLHHDSEATPNTSPTGGIWLRGVLSTRLEDNIMQKAIKGPPSSSTLSRTVTRHAPSWISSLSLRHHVLPICCVHTGGSQWSHQGDLLESSSSAADEFSLSQVEHVSDDDGTQQSEGDLEEGHFDDGDGEDGADGDGIKAKLASQESAFSIDADEDEDQQEQARLPCRTRKCSVL